MSQIGQIISIAPVRLNVDTPIGNDWVVDFSYQLDAGGFAQSRVVVGSDPPYLYPGSPLVAFWSGPNSTITVSPNPPGTTNPVVLACPDLIKATAFGVKIKGVPFQLGA